MVVGPLSFRVPTDESPTIDLIIFHGPHQLPHTCQSAWGSSIIIVRVLSFVTGTRAPGRKQLQWSGRSVRISYLVSNSEQETRARNEKFYYSIEKKRIGKLQGRRLYCLNFFLMISWKVITIIVVISFYVNINFIFNKFSKRQLHRTIDPIYKYFRAKSLFVFMDT